MEIFYQGGAVVSVKVSHPILARLTADELVLAYGPDSTSEIGEATAQAESAYAAGDLSQPFIDAAVAAMVSEGIIAVWRGAEVKA